MNIKEKLNQLRADYAEHDMELQIEDNILIDEDHLDCVWYGGEYAAMTAEIDGKSYLLILRVEGVVRISASDVDGNELWEYKDKNNTGAWRSSCSELRDNITGDKQYKELDKAGRLFYSNNSWIEFVVRNAAGEIVGEEQVLDDTDDLLKSLDNPSAWLSVIWETVYADKRKAAKDAALRKLHEIEKLADETYTDAPEDAPVFLDPEDVQGLFNRISRLAGEAIAVLENSEEV